MTDLFKEKYKEDDLIYFWYDEFGANCSKVWHYSEPNNAYLMNNGLYLHESAIIFETKEELYEYAKTHKRTKSTDCGCSFGCDFLPFY